MNDTDLTTLSPEQIDKMDDFRLHVADELLRQQQSPEAWVQWQKVHTEVLRRNRWKS